MNNHKKEIDERITFMKYQLNKIKYMVFRIVLFFCIILYSCQQQRAYPYEGLSPEDKAWIDFDIKDFNQNKTIKENDMDYYQYKLDNGTTIFKSFRRDTFKMNVIHPDGLIVRHYVYHSNGKLAYEEMYYLKDPFPIGKSHFYDKKGKLLKVVDYDEPFTFTMQDVLNFLEQEEISHFTLRRTTDGFEDYHERDTLWKISTNYYGNFQTYYILDGQTGEVLKKVDYIRHE